MWVFPWLLFTWIFGALRAETAGVLKLSFSSNRVPLILETCLSSCSPPTWSVSLNQAGINQSVEIPITDYWMLNNKFTVRVFDGHNSKDLLGYKNIEGISSRSFSSNNIFLDDGGILEVGATIQCKENFYGDRCTKKCISETNSNFICLSDGSRACKSGWKGKDCELPSCQNDCSKNGRCIGPNQCKCLSGYKGSDCSECIPLEGCVHGRCSLNRTNTCQCDKGWAGPLCDIGGRCIPKGANVYDCECRRGFKGRYCEIKVQGCDSTVCSPNSLCIESHDSKASCKCRPCYSGKNCSVADSDCLIQVYGPRITVNNIKGSSDSHGITIGALICFAVLVTILSILFVLLYKKISKMISSPSMENKLNEERGGRGQESESTIESHGFKAERIVSRSMHFPSDRYTISPLNSTSREQYVSFIEPPPDYSKAISQNYSSSSSSSSKIDYPIKVTVT
ncbi:hypothetical protein WR25_00216 [Diploscapter pachys]|uniref:Delta-like protein n=1 Tax=Diploscapter pachys TaxID=2018661 RepID=A0A2A2J4I1_9BILA|nr:hypothetical protein WR25_00216 [Diploscapter pachys]